MKKKNTWILVSRFRNFRVTICQRTFLTIFLKRVTETLRQNRGHRASEFLLFRVEVRARCTDEGAKWAKTVFSPGHRCCHLSTSTIFFSNLSHLLKKTCSDPSLRLLRKVFSFLYSNATLLMLSFRLTIATVPVGKKQTSGVQAETKNRYRHTWNLEFSSDFQK